mgnify:CR=1 FL=1
MFRIGQLALQHRDAVGGKVHHRVGYFGAISRLNQNGAAETALNDTQSDLREVGMTQMIIGIFEDAATVNKAVDGLRDHGYDDESIGVIAAEAVVGEDVDVNERTRVPEGAAIGAGAGGAAAALAVGLTSVGAVATGGVGLVAAGPVVAALAGAGAGAAGGGLLGTLVGLGLREDEARVVDEEVEEGAIIIATEPIEGKADPKAVFSKAGAKRVFAREA